MKKEDIQNLFTILATNINEEHAEAYKSVIENIELENIKSPDEFYLFIVYEWNKFLRNLIKTKISSDTDIIFIYQHYNFVEKHIQELIILQEGPVCCADKSKTIINCLLNYFKTGTEVIFDYNDEYTFGYPKAALTTHTQIIEYYHALKSLYYGNIKFYLPVFKNILGTKYSFKKGTKIKTLYNIKDVKKGSIGTIIKTDNYIASIKFYPKSKNIVKKLHFSQLKEFKNNKNDKNI